MTQQEKTALEQQVAALKEQKAAVTGSKCEVYSRACGYLRPTQNWNKGKREEFAMRKMYVMK
ncbi:Anaerobic ribonucleoside-triphosphate reductase [Parelusimicrobium proximum]|uniref:anaerobic ribonucleoside-triphosphate reductase n=1 Tax=Parelusimicrobium proximum TaxID=3228953 RepID=UPI003D16F2FD